MADLVQLISQISSFRNVAESPDKQTKPLEEACRNFESIFVQHMMKEMRQTIPRDGLLSGGSAEQMYTGMLDSEMAKAISMQRGIGLAAVLYEQLAAGSATAEKDPE